MERTSQSTGNADREHREALEQAQMELRAARATLETAAEDAARAQTVLEGAIAEATLRRDQAAARLTALREEQRNLAHRLEHLAPRLKAKRDEDELLARGAELRDKYVDWNPADRRQQVGSGSRPPPEATGYALIAVFVLLLLFMMFR